MALIGVAASAAVYAGFSALFSISGSLAVVRFLHNLQWVGITAAPPLFLLFALQYSGHVELISRRSVAALFVVPAVVVLSVWTNSLHGLFWSEVSYEFIDGVFSLGYSPGPVWGLNLSYSFLCNAATTFLLLRTGLTRRDLYLDQSASLVIGGIVPWGAAVLTLTVGENLGPPISGVDLTPYVLWLMTLAVGNAFHRYGFMSQIPAVERLGRETAMEAVPEGIVTLNGDGEVVDFNGRAEEFLGLGSTDRGRKFSDIVELDGGIESLVEGSVGFKDGGRFFELMAVSTERVRRGWDVGYTVLVHDATVRDRRERRLRQLKRVNDLIRDTLREVAGATTREEVEESVLDSFASSDLYDEAEIDRSEMESGATEEEVLVPLSSGSIYYGSLRVRAEGRGIGEEEKRVLEELGGIVAVAIDAQERKRAMSSKSVTKLGIVIRDRDAFLLKAAEALGQDVEVVDVVNGPEGSLNLFLRVPDGGPLEEIEVMEQVESLSELGEDGECIRLFVNLRGGSPLFHILGSGGRITSAGVEDGRYLVEAELPARVEVREIFGDIGDEFPGTEMVEKRVTTREAATIERGKLLESLTESQRRSLKSAYLAGYFDWPRRLNKGELAERVGVSSPTLSEHMRKGLKKVLGPLFD